MIKKWQGEPLVRLPILLLVGVGGLEPPTSASQTRRAGRLRYTPADKSIIRSMRKRQETPPHHQAILLWVLATIFILLLQACSPATAEIRTPSTAPTYEKTKTPIHTPPTPTMTVESVQEPDPTLSSTVDCLLSGGELQSDSLYSETLNVNIHFYIYLPPCYHSSMDQYYPVVYLLHGLLQTHEQWLRLGLVERMDALIADKSIPPFIVILPLEESFDPPQTSLYPDAIVNELIPWIDEHYRTSPQKKYRSIGGVSRGAAWAVKMGFEYHDTFAKVGAHSLPLFDADSAHLLTWVTQIPAEDLPQFFIDIGRDDQEWETAQDFTNLLNEHNIPHEWYLFTGGHTEAYWIDHLDQYLRWYANGW
jgi:enterochelin esterase-like enzyme